MKAIMVMFDSLNRHMLPNYGCEWIKAPNFQRLGEKTVTFDNNYAGSLPCIPARRELHTGRYNFLHRSWGPMEPFDDSMPEILKKNGIYTHLVSDHQHYWEDGGCTYHTRYNSWEISRGQEGDAWKGQVKDPVILKTPFKMSETMTQMMVKKTGMNMFRQDVINRQYMDTEDKMPQAVTFEKGIDFINNNFEEDNWFLQIETFDPHEPFFASQRFRDMYKDDDYEEEEFDWPPYSHVNESDGVVLHGKKRYAALLSMCDFYLGKVIDIMDRHNMWEDTMLIVNTDHGYLLGEHGWWAKSIMPTYNEIAHTPFFVWDPRLGIKNARRKSLVQTIDIAPTLLEFFNMEIPRTMEGKPVKDVILSDEPIRETAMFGYHGGHINITDGKYIYMRGPVDRTNKPLYEYTLMPTHMRCMFDPSELQDINLSNSFDFSKGCKTMKIEAGQGFINPAQYGSKLFDLENDPLQKNEIEDFDVEVRLTNEIAKKMHLNDSPSEQYVRMGIPENEEYTKKMLIQQKKTIKESEIIQGLEGLTYEDGVYNQVMAFLNTTPENMRNSVVMGLKSTVEAMDKDVITKDLVKNFVSDLPIDQEQKDMALYFMDLSGRTS
ncbi:sulfatase [Vallitalea longa]|uniref:Sulfatase n=1 Tax=Vallitalea longa TaxID=2936439 RepID=A0A9W6DDR3_9FIRM|nr:sulfatase [Vallitalea longa]GKX27542.1 sulfatase [Vallitalea longa]